MLFRSHHRTGIDHRMAGKSRSQSLGLPGSAFSVPGADLPGLLPLMGTGKSDGYGAVCSDAETTDSKIESIT